ncbi:acyl-CoA dehydrogenase/oxidase C-terminal [Xylogone sp. PMI_703]|nr:acyl-CoA dehydrogenase/oxidase C-terminal [Xylogone sp. PMI_703]
MTTISNNVKVTALSMLLWGGKDRLRRREEILKVLTNNPVFSKSLVTVPSLARKDAWTRAVFQARELIAIKKIHGWSNEQFIEAIRMIDDSLPVLPQFRIFLSNLERQMSDEQKKIWVPKAERFEIFGCYAQTELGHGSNVKGIETTATFDGDTDEFIINSPTLSSTKYWIGASGIWATHALVVARLIIHGKDLGNHIFLTQLRNLETQELMPGVEIYELGPKVFQGMLGVDNGALQFHQVRVPRNQMLARNAQVHRDGSYSAPKNTKHSYGSMVTVRALMAQITGFDLVKAVATAYHYTTFRKQFGDRGAEGETPVFNYASVRFRLLPLLAKGTALILVGRTVKDAYDRYTTNMLKTGETSQLEDLHLQTVGAKVYSTEITARGIEVCRIVCGGHGYSALAGFGRMYANAVNAVTYEGDNFVLSQQIPRAILKHYRNGTEGTLPSLADLTILGHATSNRNIVQSKVDWLEYKNQKWVLEERLVRLIKSHMEDTEKGKDTSFSVHALTMAYCDMVYWKGFWEVVKACDIELREQLVSLVQVFSLSILQDAYKDLVGEQFTSQDQQNSLKAAFEDAIDRLARNTASIIDGYGFTEYEMDSALARADMSPYEALWRGAQKSEMNHLQHLWPAIVGARGIWKNLEASKL